MVSRISTDLTADRNHSIEGMAGTLGDMDGTIIEIRIRVLETMAGTTLRQLERTNEFGETIRIRGDGVETLQLDGARDPDYRDGYEAGITDSIQVITEARSSHL